MNARLVALALGAAFAAAAVFACSGTPGLSGDDEPVRVQNGTFISGSFPPAATAPTITSIDTASTVIHQGEIGKSIAGRASPDGYSVGLRFEDLGTGYWVVPLAGPDPQNNNELTWSTSDDFGTNLPTGLHTLDIVAFDGAGNAGPVKQLSLCIESAVPDNLNACDAKLKPPASVFSLSWDTPVDLDLVVVTPDGRIVSAKHPRTVAPPANGPGASASVPANAGVFDHDSNANCVIDGFQREDLVFQQYPPSGSYLVYASLFDACGQADVHFQFSLWEATTSTTDPTEQVQVESITKEGFMLPIEASAGATLGTFVTEVPY